MKKIFKSLLMSALVLTAGAFVACTEKEGDDNEKFEGMPEITATADVTGVTLEGGVVTVTVTSNAPWSATVDTEGVSLSKNKGNGDATVNVTVPASTAAREIKVTFVAEGVMAGIDLTDDAVVSITQNATGSLMISGITPEAVGEGADFELENVLVVATGSQAYIIADESGAMMVYGNNHGRTVGEKINISGEVTVYTSGSSFGTPQFGNTATVEVVSTGNEVTYNPTVLDGAAFDAMLNQTMAKEVEFTGKWVVSGSYINIEDIEGANKTGSIKYVNNADYAEFNGQTVVIKGFFVGVSSGNYVNVLPYSVETDPNAPALNVDRTSLTFAATDDANARQTFTATTNGLEGYELTWAIDNETDFTLGKQLGNTSRTTLYVTPKAANTGAAKSATVTVTYSNGTSSVTKSVAVVQEGVVATTYSMIDKVANLTAGVYYMAAYCEEDSNKKSLEPYVYQMFNGDAGTSSGNTDLYTSGYEFVNNDLVIDPARADYPAVTVTLEAVAGQTNQYYVKNSKDGKYLASTEAANRKLALQDTPYAWTAENHENGGITLSDGGVWVGSASATSKFIRSYNKASTCKFGLYFFKQN